MPGPYSVIMGVCRPNLRTKPAVVVTASTSLATWSATDKSVNVTLSGADLVATAGGTPGNSYIGRGTTATTAIGAGVKRWWMVDVTVGGGNLAGVGIGNASIDPASDLYLGVSANGLCYFDSGDVYRSGAPVTNLGVFADDNDIIVAVDGGNKVWFGVNAVPDVTTGGIDISAMGTVYPAYNLQTTGVVTANFVPSAYTAPAGYSTFP